MKTATALFTCIALFVVSSAFAAQPGKTHAADADLAASARVLLAMPLLPATLASVLTLASAAPQPTAAAVSAPHMQMMRMPDDGMIVVARVNATGDVETTCVATPEAAETFKRGARTEQH
jgi:hypothetical protein